MAEGKDTIITFVMSSQDQEHLLKGLSKFIVDCNTANAQGLLNVPDVKLLYNLMDRLAAAGKEKRNERRFTTDRRQ